MKNLLTIFFLCFIFNSNAQSNYDEVLYLKNGSIIRGIIIEQIPNKTIKIQTHDRNVFVYPFEEVEKITKEPKLNNQNNYDFSSMQLPEIEKEKRGGIVATVLGTTFFSVGMPFLVSGARLTSYFGIGLGRLIPGAILTTVGIPLMIVGPVKLGKYSRLKNSSNNKVSLYFSPSIQPISNFSPNKFLDNSSMAIGSTFSLRF